jgi:hypothetical protein
LENLEREELFLMVIEDLLLLKLGLPEQKMPKEI